MKIIDCLQGSPEWLKARLGIPTASEMHRLVTPKGKVKEGDGPQTYLCEKLAEKWSGEPLDDFSSFAMEQGEIIEKKAKPAYRLIFSEPLDDVGFITNDAGTVGCSPDGVVPNASRGAEVKCPELQTHFAYLLDGVVPEKHIVQVQTCLFVTGVKDWRFMSYSRTAPAFDVLAERDPKIQDAIEEAVETFTKKFRDAWKIIVEKNGGKEPEHKSRPVPPRSPDMWPKSEQEK